MPGSLNPSVDPNIPSPGNGAVDFSSIAAPAALLNALRRLLRGVPKPILLVGEEGSGKHFIARRIAAAWLCERPDPESGACGTCASCRLFRSGDPLDLVTIEPPESKKTIPVSRVREKISETLNVYPQVSRCRVYVVSAEKADTLNEQGQNALLKPLEDHADFIRFIILAEDADRLLPTIVSRCAVIRIGRRERRDVEAILRASGISDDTAIGLAAQYGDGLPGQALVIAGDSSFQELRGQAFALFLSLPRATVACCLTDGLAFFRAEKARIPLVLQLFSGFARDLLFLDEGLRSVPMINRDLERELKALLEAQDRRAGTRPDPASAHRLIVQTSEALAANVNFDHAVARMLLGIRAHLGAPGHGDGGRAALTVS